MITLKRKQKNPRIKFGMCRAPNIWSANTIGIKSKSSLRIDFLFGFNRYYFRKYKQYVYVAHVGRFEFFVYFNFKKRKTSHDYTR